MSLAANSSLTIQNVRYQYSDHLGTATLELDYTGTLITYEEYYPFGGSSFQSGRSAAEVSLKRYRFTGKERDEETGFYYHGARYYCPWLARLCAADPLESTYAPQSSYAYCSNNPVGKVDEDGKGEKDKNAKAASSPRVTAPANPPVDSTGSDNQEAAVPATTNSGFTRLKGGITIPEPAVDKTDVKTPEANSSQRSPFDQGTLRVVPATISPASTNDMNATEVAEHWGAVGQWNEDNGYDANGDAKLLKRLAQSPEFNSFADKVFDVEALVSGGALVKTGLSRLAGGGVKTFFTVQGTEDAARLRTTGTPWPTGAQRAAFGEGVYAWGSKEDALQYLKSYGSRGLDDKLEIVEFSISNKDFLKLKSIELEEGSDAATDFYDKHSAHFGEGLPHGYDYLKLPTGLYGYQHYFSKEIFNILKFK